MALSHLLSKLMHHLTEFLSTSSEFDSFFLFVAVDENVAASARQTMFNPEKLLPTYCFVDENLTLIKEDKEIVRFFDMSSVVFLFHPSSFPSE